ncbi:hypothetical protein Q4S45_22290 [Massilia sp. R2A-15]|uniref:NACHT domain-containing protein n=1 Tax=Massilia sp. R2A-15 TaxID=3064278 RepID=UPI002733EE4C|nr:hypothetical protein [Massilia sp. R2A-15]WLI89389.1 hypothetical protein Q4S45_22290 [Massilia sp. R2A-15]
MLISEAGTGKTFECESKATSLFAAGEAAFFLRLETVASVGVTGALYGKNKRRFDTWYAAASGMGYFFLDSVDELELAHGNFKDALERLAADLDGALGRATIVVTSRPVAIDRVAFRELLPVSEVINQELDGKDLVRLALHGPEKSEELPDFREVELLPLSDAQILQFSRSRGIESPQDLLAAIQAKHAHDFARRPQDLIELCDDWRDHHAIRPHFEQVKTHVLDQLAARPNRKEKADLAAEKARTGAQRLALAAVLSRRLTIRYSAGADLHDSGEAPIDPRPLLTEWTVREISALLERPLFAAAGYGRVRFRHRSVLEYLAACEVHQLVESGKLSLSAGYRLLFGLTDANERVLKPSMRPVAGWLALLRQDVFDEILKVESSTLLIYGDPESLMDHQRQRALLSFVVMYGKGRWRGVRVPDIQIERLAQPSLAQTVLDVWRDGVENPEVRNLLIQLVSVGKFRTCADLMASLASTVDSSPEERFDAIAALAGLADPRTPALIEAALASGPNWSAELAGWIATALYPEHVTDTQLLEIAARLPFRTRRLGDYAARMASRIDMATVSSTRLESLLSGLLAQAEKTIVVVDDELRDSETSMELSPLLAAASIRLLKVKVVSREVLRSSVMIIRLADDVASSSRRDELRQLLNALPYGARREICEIDLHCLERLKLGADTTHWLGKLLWQGPIEYSERDLPWIIEALGDGQTLHTHRQALLELAVYLATQDGETSKTAEMRAAVADSSSLLAQLVEAVASKKPNEQFLKMMEDERKRKETQLKKSADEAAAWMEFWRELANQPSVALAPERQKSTIWKLGILLRKTGDTMRWNRVFLEKHFGRIATDALRIALMSYWRTMVPSVGSERKADEKNTYLVVWTLGLLGIYAEAEDPAWSQHLSDREAVLVARYALIELNGFPAWLRDAASNCPSQIDTVIGGELDEDLDALGSDVVPHSSLLQALRYGPANVALLLQPRLLKWLNGPAKVLMLGPYNASSENGLHQVLQILMTHGDAAARNNVESIATQQIASCGSTYLGLWMPVLCALNPNVGIAHLLRLLKRLPVEKEGEAVELIASLVDSRRAHDLDNFSALTDIDRLMELTAEVYRHVRPDIDVVHVGAYSRGNRDYAEDARRYIFEAFMRRSGPKALQAKLALAELPNFDYLRDRIREVARERLAAEVDQGVSEIPEIASLFNGKDLPPKTGSAMAQVLVDRLDDLQALMLADTSPRAAWAAVQDENTLRPAIAREFLHMANGAYTVDQEAVTADGKETDIRFRTPPDLQATIELKIGEKDRSAKDLCDTIEMQLVNKYMAYSQARTGCLLVTIADPKRRWKHPDTGRLIDHVKLQELLDVAAQAAQQRLGGTARVLARVLDLTPRLGVEGASTQTPDGTVKNM